MKRATMAVMMMVLLLLAASVFCMTAKTGEAGKQNLVIPENEHGLSGWTQNYIEATGTAVSPADSRDAQAKALARRGAIVDLQRNLLKSIIGIQPDSRTTPVSGQVTSEVHGVIRNVEIIEETWDGKLYTVSGRVRLPLVSVNIRQ